MLIDKLTRFCDERFRASCLGHCGKFCSNKAKCQGSCGKCLDQIHFDYYGRKDYDCANLIDFYVCRYTHKYASEIMYLLRSSTTLNDMNSYNIISIGCGGCSDLIAFDTFAGDINTSYLGIELNFLWHDVHSFILEYNTKPFRKIRFVYGDALDFIEE